MDKFGNYILPPPQSDDIDNDDDDDDDPQDHTDVKKKNIDESS